VLVRHLIEIKQFVGTECTFVTLAQRGSVEHKQSDAVALLSVPVVAPGCGSLSQRRLATGEMAMKNPSKGLKEDGKR
jgi:hypothetical protein